MINHSVNLREVHWLFYLNCFLADRKKLENNLFILEHKIVLSVGRGKKKLKIFFALMPYQNSEEN